MRALILLVLLVSPAGADSLLGGRYTMKLPLGMTIVANPPDSHGHALPSWAATRAELRKDDHTAFTAIAYDSFMVAGAELHLEVLEELRAQGLSGRTAPLKLPEPLRGIEVVPADNTAGLIYAAYVADEEGEIVVVAFYARGEARKDIASAITTARAAAATLRGGGRLARPRRAYLAIGRGNAEVVVADGWRPLVFRTDPPNAAVELREVVSLGKRAGSCTVDEGTLPAREVALRRARIRGHAVRWQLWTDRGEYHAAVAVPFETTQLRVRCSATTAKVREVAISMIEAIR